MDAWPESRETPGKVKENVGSARSSTKGNLFGRFLLTPMPGYANRCARNAHRLFFGALPPASPRFGPLAQLVEQLTLNQLVRGSNPRRPTSKKKHLAHFELSAFLFSRVIAPPLPHFIFLCPPLKSSCADFALHAHPPPS